MVAENGAVALIPDGAGGVRTEYADSEPVREANALRLAAAAARIVREVPGATLSRDSVGRVTDIAIDHAQVRESRAVVATTSAGRAYA